jgi:hypothetical protein
MQDFPSQIGQYHCFLIPISWFTMIKRKVKNTEIWVFKILSGIHTVFP